MATKYWTGAVDGDWTESGNWEPSGSPTDGDDVIITGALSDSADIDAATIALGSPLASLSVAADYGGSIGDSVSPLAIDVLKLRYYAPSGLAHFAGEFTQVDVRSGHDATLTVNGSFVSASAVYIVTGEVTLLGEFGTTWVAYDKDALGDVVLYNDAETSIIQAGGYVESSTPSDLRIFGGRCVYTGTGYATDPVILQLGGEVDYQADAALDTAVVLFAGTLSTSLGNIPTSGNPIRIFSGGTLDVAGDYSTFASSGLLIERMGGEVLVGGVSIDIGGYDL